MHIKANTYYEMTGFVYGTFIDSLTWLVYLFLMISGFGMCAGYLSRFQGNEVSLEDFYKRRYVKILPFFVFLILIALILEPSLENLYEAGLEVTLLYGLLPNNTMSVLGVCWTLGVIFLFYLLFPAFTVLMKTKRRAWASLAVSLWINFACQNYFFGEAYVTELFTPRHSFIYCMPLFIGGGIVYLYRQRIREVYEKYRWGVLLVCIAATFAYFCLPEKVYHERFFILLPLFMLWLSYAVGVDSIFLSNKAMKYLSSISMEMYLAQMVIFRLLEKCGLIYVFGRGWSGFIMTCILTVIGLVIFIEGYKFMVRIVKRFWC